MLRIQRHLKGLSSTLGQDFGWEVLLGQNFLGESFLEEDLASELTPVATPIVSAQMERTALDLGARFRLLSQAGAGAGGVVYKAWDTKSLRTVAIKVLTDVKGPWAGHFRDEVRALAGLRHPGIVGFLESGVSRGSRPFIAMEWLEGLSLEAHLDRPASP